MSHELMEIRLSSESKIESTNQPNLFSKHKPKIGPS